MGMVLPFGVIQCFGVRDGGLHNVMNVLSTTELVKVKQFISCCANSTLVCFFQVRCMRQGARR